MRKISFAISTLMLLSPMAASAAYMTPGELVASVQSGSPRSFSLSAHAATADKTYVSVWANGTTQGVDPMTMQMTTKATVDVVSGDMKIRIKTDIMTIAGTMYIKLTSVDGTFKNPLADMTAKLQQQKWIAFPFDEAMLKDMVSAPVFSLSSAESVEADSMMTMTSAEGKNGTTYSLMLKPDTAANLAQSLRDMLQETQTISTDFFPWRDLAASIDFSMTVQTNTKGEFVSSAYNMGMKGPTTSFSFTGTEKAAAALKLTVPTNALSIEEAFNMLGGLNELPLDYMFMGMPSSDMMEEDMYMEDTTDSMMEEDTSSTFDWTEESAVDSIECEFADPLKLVMLQRDGTCPVTKTTTRHRGW